MALEANGDNIVSQYKSKGWTVLACVHRIFLPTKERTKTGKPVMIPVTHRWVDMFREDGQSIRFYLCRSGIFSDSRQKKDSLLQDAFKGRDQAGVISEVSRMTGDLEQAKMAVWALS